MNTSSNNTGVNSGCLIVGLIIFVCCLGSGVITYFTEASPKCIAITLSLLLGPIILICIFFHNSFQKEFRLLLCGLVFVIWLFIIGFNGCSIQKELEEEREYNRKQEQLDYSRPDPWSAPQKGESSAEYLLRLNKHLLEEEKRKQNK